MKKKTEEIIDKNMVFKWKFRIPLFSSFIWKNIVLGFLITAVILWVFLFVISGFSFNLDVSHFAPDIYFAGGFIALIIGLTLLVFVILFWNGFDACYAVDKKGLYQSIKGASSKVHSLAIIAGILGRSPAAVGAGLTAKGGEERFISWQEARLIKVDKKEKYIYVSRAFLGIYPIDMFCSEKNFNQVLSYIQKHISNKTSLYIKN